MSATTRTYTEIALSFIILIIIVAGCGPQSSKISLVTDECTPQNLRVMPNDSKLSLVWDTNCADSVLISGYNVYLEEKPLDPKYDTTRPPKSLKPFGGTAYPGDTDPEKSFETMDIYNLDNGVEYYLAVRTVFPDKSISYSSNIVSVIPRPEGEFELAFRYSEQNDGFSFAKGKSVRADAEENDLYFYSKDGFDFIASPQRLNGFLRHSGFYSLGKTDNIYQYPNVDLDFDAVEKIPVKEGESYVIKTADNRYAKIRIDQATGEGKSRVLKISYIYQTRPEFTQF